MTSSDPVLLALLTGPDHLFEPFLDRVQALAPSLPLLVFSEFPAARGTWIPFRFDRSDGENWARARAEIDGRRIHLCAQILAPNMPYGRLRHLGWRLAPWRGVYFNEALDHFMLRPRSFGAISRHVTWRTKNWIWYQLRDGGELRTFFWRIRHPRAFRRPANCWLAEQNAVALGLGRPRRHRLKVPAELPAGTAVVIPSRDGRELLRRCLPLVLDQRPGQVVVVDNGSSDGTAAWLQSQFPEVEVLTEPSPLSFAAAVNRGITAARYRYVCLLNNDMEIRPGFFAALERTLDRDPQLLCATAQIFFPDGTRREETGKAVMPPYRHPDDFPLFCQDPLPGEDGSEVLYGSGGCSLYRTAIVRALGGFDESFTPAYVEDLDLGYRGWLSGHGTVFAAAAEVVHHHRSTTARYFAADALRLAVERNYLRFLRNSIASRPVFERLWRREITRLNREAAWPSNPPVPAEALAYAAWANPPQRPLPAGLDDATILALGSGDINRFPGRARATNPRLVICSCYAPFPLAHGGAVRIYNLLRRAAEHYSQTLIYFADQPATPPAELLDVCEEVIVVRRYGTHQYPRRDLPDVVQDFTSPSFRAILERVVAQKSPFAVQLEFTQLAQYLDACRPARTILVEHDITIDLYRQLRATARRGARWHLEQQLPLWERFETSAWQRADAVVTMSDKDRAAAGPRAVTIPNGVDLDRFQPSREVPDPRRLLFLGSFAHLPNLQAIEWFLREVWPRLAGFQLHIIAGSRPEYYLDFYRDRVTVKLDQPGLELDAFVADVRPAYARAGLVIAPLVASAGTNIKVLEAMAMGKAIVATSAGVNGLDVRAGEDFLLADTAAAFAQAIEDLAASPAQLDEFGRRARASAEARYSWDRMAAAQAALYERLRNDGSRNARIE